MDDLFIISSCYETVCDSAETVGYTPTCTPISSLEYHASTLTNTNATNGMKIKSDSAWRGQIQTAIPYEIQLQRAEPSEDEEDEEDEE